MGKPFEFRLNPVLKQLNYQCAHLKKNHASLHSKQLEIELRIKEIEKSANLLIETVIQLRAQGLFEKGELLLEVSRESYREKEQLEDRLLKQKDEIEGLKKKLKELLHKKKRVETLLANAYAEWVKKQSLHEEHFL